MGKIAEAAKAAGAPTLQGPVQVTYPDGSSKTFASEAEAEKALADFAVEYRRGGVFAKEKAKRTSFSRRKRERNTDETGE